MNTILIFLIVGLIGACLMFAGDMTLYYSKDDYVSDGTLQPVIDIMKHESKARLYAGAILGPIAAFFYCVGYYHIVLIMERFQTLGWISFFVNCFGIIMGGAFHSHWVYFGRIGRLSDKEAIEEVLAFTKLFNKISYAVIGLGFAMLLVFIAFGITIFPRWIAVFTPGVLFLLTPVVGKLPKGRLHMIVCGGWSNLISVIYYIAALIVIFA